MSQPVGAERQLQKGGVESTARGKKASAGVKKKKLPNGEPGWLGGVSSFGGLVNFRVEKREKKTRGSGQEAGL